MGEGARRSQVSISLPLGRASQGDDAKTVHDVDSDGMQAARARREVVKMLRQNDKVVQGLSRRGCSVHDGELLKRLSSVDDPASILRQAGMEDLESVLKVCELLPHAVQAKEPPAMVLCPRGAVATVVGSLVCIGLAFPAFYEFIFMPLQWTGGRCRIMDFTNGTCVHNTGCYLNIRIVARVGGELCMLDRIGWQPAIESDPVDHTRSRYVGEAFRCCSPGDGRLECCAWLDPITKDFCDAWPTRTDREGVKCQSDGWECRFKVDTGTAAGGCTTKKVTELEPHVAAHVSVWITFILSVFMFFFVIGYLVWVLRKDAILAKYAEFMDDTQIVQVDSRQAEDAREHGDPAKRNVAGHGKADRNSVDGSSNGVGSNDQGFRANSSTTLASGMGDELGTGRSLENDGGALEQTQNQETVAGVVDRTTTEDGAEGALKQRSSEVDSTIREDWSTSTSVAVPERNQSISGVSSIRNSNSPSRRSSRSSAKRSGQRRHEFASEDETDGPGHSKPRSTSPKRSRSQRREIGAAGDLVSPKEQILKARSRFPGLAKDHDRYLLGAVFKSMEEDIEDEIKHRETLRPLADNTLRKILEKQGDVRGHALLPGRVPTTRELRLQAQAQNEDHRSQPVWSRQISSPTPPSSPESTRPAFRATEPQPPTGPVPFLFTAEVHYDPLAKLASSFPEHDKATHPCSPLSDRSLTETRFSPSSQSGRSLPETMHSASSSPHSRGGPVAPSRLQRPLPPGDMPPGMWSPSAKHHLRVSASQHGSHPINSRATDSVSTAKRRSNVLT